MPTIDVYDIQDDFLQDTRRFVALLGGVGSGKSIAGAARSGLASLGRIGDLTIRTPNTGMIIAPTYNVLRDATIPAFRNMASEFIKTLNTTPPINAHMINGSTIFFRSADNPENLRGPSLSWFWGDEAALYNRGVWPIMIGRLREFGQFGYAWLTTTPKGRNWLYQEFVQKQRPEYFIYKAATRRNPFLDREYYQFLKESYTGDFARQELDGDFVAFEGLIYPFFDRDTHISTSKRPTQFVMVVAGVDWGMVNPGVIVVYGVDSDGRMWGLHEEYVRRRRVEEWAKVAHQLEQQYHIEFFFCDPAEPDNIAEFNKLDIHAVPAENEVWLGIQSVHNRLVVQPDGLPRIILPPDFVNTATEFEQYQWMEHKDGLHDKPKKVNDHAMDATRYASVGVDTMFGIEKAGAMHYEPEAVYSHSEF